MNDEKIKELAEKAGFVYWQNEEWGPGPGHIDWSAVYDKEFAKYTELLVQECIEVLTKRFMGDLNREDMEVRRCITDVKNHFGLKDEI